ncbi:MAG: lipopolysaccharide heptosyltransferase II [Bryobacteraceae bacterium]
MAFNPAAFERISIRATNWLGDAVMSLPAIRVIRQVCPRAEITLVARPWLADLYARESAIDRVIPCSPHKSLGERRVFAASLRAEHFDAAFLLPNSLDAALTAWLARIPERIGYARDGRGWLLTRPIRRPEPGDIPRHERFYYLELLRRSGLIEHFPDSSAIRLEGIPAAREAGAARLRELGVDGAAIGTSPGAAYGDAKRWLPDGFAAAAGTMAAALCAAVLVFGSVVERELCEAVAAGVRARGADARNLAGATTLREFIDLAAACRLYLTNDSGAMHVASALGVPTVAIFGATDDATTGPTSPLARVVREHAECSPCLLRNCPIDHRCMTRVTPERVAAVSLELININAETWTPEAKS